VNAAITYLGIISHEELEALRLAPSRGRVHPLVNILVPEGAGRARHIIESSARLVLEKNPEWLKSLKPRLLATYDFTHASSALGKIRAYGYLLETWNGRFSRAGRPKQQRASPNCSIHCLRKC
jgi:hypothetical protein